MPRIKRRLCLLLYPISLTILFLVTLNVFIWFINPRNNVPDSVVKSPQDDDYDYIRENFPAYKEFPPILNRTFPKGQVNKEHYKLDCSLPSNKLDKPWFMKDGTIQPDVSYSHKLALWPEDIDEGTVDSQNDRIVNQLMYIPEGYDESDFKPKGKLPLKKILLAYGRSGWGNLEPGRNKFLNDKCPVNACYIMTNPDLIDMADAVIFKDRFAYPVQGRRNANQIWIAFLLECPFHTQLFRNVGSNFNWTATYRHDSDIVTPYEKFVSYSKLFKDPSYFAQSQIDLFNPNSTKSSHQIKVNYAQNKTSKVAWFVSNCSAKNKRLQYARELSKHIEVDIYGSCGQHKCPRYKSHECFEMLNKDYKFYLAFENSNCRDYITEKFFKNSLGTNSEDLNIVPIVMGGHPHDYKRVAPENSYIHVDQFRSPAELASYLKMLDANDELYNRFFEWKATPRKGEFINTYFWCRICALLHAPPDHQKKINKSYRNFGQWWGPTDICLENSYRWS